MIKIGSILYGFCGGYFGHSYSDKRVEAIGVDWLIAREIDSGEIYCAFFTNISELESYLEPSKDEY